MTKPMGRPPVDEPRIKNVLIRLTQAEYDKVAKAAKLDSISISKLGQTALVNSAKSRIAKHG